MTTDATSASATAGLMQRLSEALSGLVDGLNSLLERPSRWIAAIALVAVLQLTLILSHEPWRDEWQALQIAVQSPHLSDLFESLRYEGHPPLWYFLLRGLSSVIGPQATLAAAAVLISLAGQAIILFIAPFSRAERLLLSLSEFLLFEYFSISRSLSLGVLLVLVTLALRNRRAVWLPIALLPLCDFQFGVISVGFAILQWRERKVWWPGAFLWLVCGLLAAWTVRPAAAMVTANPQRGFSIEALSFLDRLGTVLFPLQWDGGLRWDSPLPPGLTVLGWVGFLIFAWMQTANSRLHRALLFGFIASCLLFSIGVYSLSTRHIMLVAVVLIALQWHFAANGSDRGWRLWLLGGAICGLLTAASALSMPFDSARLAANEMARRGLIEQPWMSFPSEHGQPIAALTGIQFERPERPCWQQFVRWDEKQRIDEASELESILPGALARHGHFYLLSNRRLNLKSVEAREIAIFHPGFNKQGYAIYEIGHGQSRHASRVGPCVANQRPLR